MPLFSNRRGILTSWIGPSAFDAPSPSPENISHVVGLAHLWAAQFQQIMNLALAGAGGLLMLVRRSSGRRAVAGGWRSPASSPRRWSAWSARDTS